MAISYMQDVRQKFSAGLLANHSLIRQDDSNRRQPPVLPAFNATTSPSSVCAFPPNPVMNAAASLQSMLTPEQIMLGHALMSAYQQSLLRQFAAPTSAPSSSMPYFPTSSSQPFFAQSNRTPPPPPPAFVESNHRSNYTNHGGCFVSNCGAEGNRKKMRRDELADCGEKKRATKRLRTDDAKQEVAAIITVETVRSEEVREEDPATKKKRPRNREKTFTCKVCSRSFGYKHVLQNHERTHTGEKPFECPECHKRFTREHHLKTHRRLHTGEKPYHCTYCERRFVQVANLRRHLRVHTGERPYACERCPAKFSDSNQLKAHASIHSEVARTPFTCDLCHKVYRRSHKCGLEDSSSYPRKNYDGTVAVVSIKPDVVGRVGENSSLNVSDSTDDDGYCRLNSPENFFKQPPSSSSSFASRKRRAPWILAESRDDFFESPQQSIPEDLSVRGSVNSSYSVLSDCSSAGDVDEEEDDDDDDRNNSFVSYRNDSFNFA